MAIAIISDPAIKIFTEQAYTLNMTDARVSIQCDTRHDAELLFDFLSSLSSLKPLVSNDRVFVSDND